MDTELGSATAILTTMDDFIFKVGLYDCRAIPFLDVASNKQVEGYCPRCRETSVFARTSFNKDVMSYKCTRKEGHDLVVYLNWEDGGIEKVGQRPSIADILKGNVIGFKRVLAPADLREPNTALGLFAHGVGIGSFVYLRRIFERIVSRRFDEYQGIEGWTQADADLRMQDKIKLMKAHLPSFMVEQRGLYSIMSLGIHELDETDCRAFFPVLFRSVLVILDQDEQKRADLNNKKELSKEIGAYLEKVAERRRLGPNQKS